jgi:hypothetical protein
VVGGCGGKKEEVVYGIPDFARGEEEGTSGCNGSLRRWDGAESLSGAGFARASEGEGDLAAGRFHCGLLYMACRCISTNNVHTRKGL